MVAKQACSALQHLHLHLHQHTQEPNAPVQLKVLYGLLLRSFLMLSLFP